MATLALSLAGQLAGGLIGGPIGATVGRALGALAGSAIDGMLFGEKPETRGSDIRLQGSSEGGAVTRLYGWSRLSGNIIWARELELLGSEGRGAKGMTARSMPAGTAIATGIDRPLASADAGVDAIPEVVTAHLPGLPGEAQSRIVVAGYAAPWPGALQLVHDATGANVLSLTRRGTIGETVTALGEGPLGVWDMGRASRFCCMAGTWRQLSLKRCWPGRTDWPCRMMRALGR